MGGGSPLGKGARTTLSWPKEQNRTGVRKGEAVRPHSEGPEAPGWPPGQLTRENTDSPASAEAQTTRPWGRPGLTPQRLQRPETPVRPEGPREGRPCHPAGAGHGGRMDIPPLLPGAPPVQDPHAQTFMWSKAIPTLSLKPGLKRGTLA